MSSQPKWSLGCWAYEWNANGSLKKVKRPDGSVITFKYDAFGRRIEKKTARATTHFVWDGNVPLHEWKTFDYRETTDNDRITWIFQDFVPVAKLQGDKSYSIISDHIGTPLVVIDNEGIKVWERELDIYGKVRRLQGDKWFIPFLYQGQYYDVETELAYNRFRYYSPDTGAYISQDPIGLWGGDNLYAYVHNTNVWVDVLGLTKAKKIATLTLSNGKTYVATSGENPLTTNEDFDKIVANSVDEAKNINGDVKYYGKCAEINAINEALLDGQTLDSLKNATIDTRFNKNRKGTDKVKPAKKDDPAEACDCCKLVLKEMNIEDKNKGCGNK